MVFTFSPHQLRKTNLKRAETLSPAYALHITQHILSSLNDSTMLGQPPSPDYEISI